MKELKLAWRYVRRHWWQYILGILALFIVDEVNTYVPRFTGEITNGLDQHTLDMGGVMGLVWKIVLIGVIIAVGRFAWRFFLFGSARSIEKELRSDLFAHLSTLSPHYYNEHKTGDLMARFINDLQAVRTLVGMNVISTFDATVMLLLVHRIDKNVEDGDTKAITRNMLIAGYAQSWCGLLIIPLAFFFGADAVASLLNIIPDFVQTGMDVAAAFLPALGFAMLAQMIMNKTVAPFFFAGFFLVAYFGISTTGVAIFAAIIVVAMTVLGDKKKAEQPAVATEDPAIGSGFDEF